MGIGDTWRIGSSRAEGESTVPACLPATDLRSNHRTHPARNPFDFETGAESKLPVADKSQGDHR